MTDVKEYWIQGEKTLENDELKKIYFGVYEFVEYGDGYLKANQYSKAQMDYFRGAFDFWFERCDASTAKTIECITDATKISFDYRFLWRGSEDTIELFIDGLAYTIIYVRDLEQEGNISLELPGGRHEAVIYLPADATLLIRNFMINSSYEIPEKKKKILWLGDSITQGFGPLRSAETFVSIVNRTLKCDVINQGIGGYIYDKKSLMPMEGYTPDLIVVSLGTNQYKTESMADVEEYYETLEAVYGSTLPIICISPIWRGDQPEDIEIFYSFCKKVCEIAGRYPNVSVIDGLTLVPHLKEYYLDNLHPNCLGTETYAANLVKELKKYI